MKLDNTKRSSRIAPLALLSLCCGMAQAESHIDLEAGKKAYEQVCFTCHGVHLEGGIGPALNDAFWRHGDDEETIYNVITHGVESSEMLPFKDVFSDEVRHSIVAYIQSQQFGLRELQRAKYPKAALQNIRLSPAAFAEVEPDYQKPVSENVIFFESRYDGVARFTAKLRIKEAGEYFFQLRDEGRSSIFLDGKEVFYSNEAEGLSAKKGKRSEAIPLQPGSYEIEIYNEQKLKHQPKFHLSLHQQGGKHITLVGRSLQGSIPKEITAGSEAKVIRKWIKDISPRTLLCLLPNQVIVAFNPETGKVENAWKQAKVNQTPSLPDRSARPSEVVGQAIQAPLLGLLSEDAQPQSLIYQQYQTNGQSVTIDLAIDGKPMVVRISPLGSNGYSIHGSSEQEISAIKLQTTDGADLKQSKNQFTLNVQ